MQCATLATTFGVYFAHLTTLEEEEKLPAVLVSSVPSIMAFTMFLFCPISTALSKVLNCVIIWQTCLQGKLLRSAPSNLYESFSKAHLLLHFPTKLKI